MNTLSKMLAQYRAGERPLPTYAELASIEAVSLSAERIDELYHQQSGWMLDGAAASLDSRILAELQSAVAHRNRPALDDIDAANILLALRVQAVEESA